MRLAAKLEPDVAKLKTLLKLGWKNFEIFTNKSYITYSGAMLMLAKAKEENDIQYIVHAPTTYFDTTVIEFAYKIGANLVNTHKIIPDNDLRQLVEYATERDIIITIENEAFPESHCLDKHKNRIPTIDVYDPIRSAGDFRRLKEKIPEIRLCIDIEHAIIRKEYPEFICACCADLAHIHICGYKGEKHHQPVYENMPLMKEVVGILKACNYKGFVVCEHNTEFHTAEIWKRTIEECGPLFGE